VVLEGLASGLPVLTSRGTGACEVVDGRETGWVVDKVTPVAIARALREVFAVEDLGSRKERARAQALAHDWPSHLEQVVDIYEEQAARRRETVPARPGSEGDRA
jgi:glycosyltransferase involved in cell wall biosynthesis